MSSKTIVFILSLQLFGVLSLAHRAGLNAYGIYVGDFNGDGKDDFIRQKKGPWASDGENTAELFLSNGRGVFVKSTIGQEFQLNGDFTNIIVGDFNGDGIDDFLRQEKGTWATDNKNTAQLFLANVLGEFTKIDLDEDLDLYGDKNTIFVGDFNGDGKDDLVRQNTGQGADDGVDTALLLISTGNNFRKVVLPENLDLNGYLTNLYVGDFNGDGKDDLLRQERGVWTLNNKINTAYLLLSTGQDSFKKIVLAEDYDLNGDLTMLHIGDFNGDGKSDVLRREKGNWATDNVNSAYLLLSQGDGNFRKIVLPEDFDIKATNTNLTIADYNGDKKDDFIRQEKNEIALDGARTTEVFLSTGDNFRKVVFPEDHEMNADVSGLYAGDFNGDKKADFIQYWGPNKNWIHYSQSEGYFI